MTKEWRLFGVKSRIKCIYLFGIKAGIQFIKDWLNFFTSSEEERNNHKKEIRHIYSRKHNLYYRSWSTDVPLVYDLIVRYMIKGGEYDIKISKSPDMIIDLGANIGIFSYLYAKRFPKAKILAVEPEAENFKILEKNLQNTNNISTYECGIWWRKAMLSIIDRQTGSWGFKCIESGERTKEDRVVAETRGVDIDTLCAENNFKSGNLIVKMDVEGTERNLFDNIDKAEWVKNLSMLIVEIHDDIYPGTTELIDCIMKKKGFVVSKQGENHIYCR